MDNFIHANDRMPLGIDLVYIPEFVKKTSVPGFVEKVFLNSELRAGSAVERLAGWFAAKEAFFKARGKKGDWLSIWIEHDASGKPRLCTSLLKNPENCSVSISHSGEYAIAVVVLEK